MGLGATFWASGGDGCRWIQSLYHDSILSPDTEAYAYYNSSISVRTISVVMAAMKVFQKSYNNLDTRESSSDGLNTGYFLLADSGVNLSAAASVCVSAVVANVGIGGGGSGIYEAIPQWKELIKSDNTPITQGEVDPSTSAVWSQRAIYQTGFIDDMGGPRGALSPGAAHWDSVCMIKTPTISTRTYFLWHYSPWAWFGTVPQVVADILMKCGIAAGSIDQTAFDSAHDAYNLTTGDPPYRTASALVGGYVHTGATSKYEIGCNRTVGERCIDLIKKCITHARDLYFINESGKFCVQSYTRGASVVGLSLADGIIGDIAWGYDRARMFNVAYTGWGGGVLVSGMANAGTERYVEPFSTAADDQMESYMGDGMSAVSASQASMDKYGEIEMRGSKRDVMVGGKLLNAESVHFPMHFSCHSKNMNIPHIAAWMRSSGKIPRTVTVTQDFRALDWGIGVKVYNVAVTGDGQTIPEMWCIERTYDFDTLTVTSVLMEQPPNT